MKYTTLIYSLQIEKMKETTSTIFMQLLEINYRIKRCVFIKHDAFTEIDNMDMRRDYVAKVQFLQPISMCSRNHSHDGLSGSSYVVNQSHLRHGKASLVLIIETYARIIAN